MFCYFLYTYLKFIFKEVGSTGFHFLLKIIFIEGEVVGDLYDLLGDFS